MLVIVVIFVLEFRFSVMMYREETSGRARNRFVGGDCNVSSS
jgi:hypothetical protein